MAFRKVNVNELCFSPVEAIGEDWGILTGVSDKGFNSMTVSWGSVGVLWSKPVVFAFVRPQRHTYGFMEREKYYTLSFLGTQFRHAMQICGSVSGRDTDKVAEAGLTPRFDAPAPYFDEAQLVLVCRKLYTSDLNPENFLDSTIETHYKGEDYHRMYLGEIVKVLKKAE